MLDQKRQKLLDWISPLRYGSKQLDILNRHSPSTGQWFVSDKRFDDWLNKEEPKCLWCFGIRRSTHQATEAIVY